VSDQTTAGAEEDFRALDPIFRIIEDGWLPGPAARLRCPWRAPLL